MRGLVVVFALLPALARAQTPPPPPPLEGELPYVEARPASDSPAALPYVEARPVEPAVQPPPPPAAETALPPPPAPIEARELSAPPPPPPAVEPAALPTPSPAPVPAAVAPTAPASELPPGAVTLPQPAAEPPAAKPEPTNADFIKGELTHLGIDRLITKRSRILVSAGYNHIGKTEYLLVYPQVGFKISDLAVGLGVPLNVEIFSSAYPPDPEPGKNHIYQFQNVGSLRKADWDEPSDYARILTYLTWGRKEDRFYLDIGQQHASSIGHGALVRRYNGNIDVNTFRSGLQLDAYNDYVGAEFMTNDVVMWDVMSALAFIKPLSFFSDSWMARSLSIGVSAAMDRQAPHSLRFGPEPACPAPGGCAPARVPLVGDDNRLVTENGVVVLGGVDVEMKLVKTENVDIKPYFDYSRFLRTGLDDATLGGGYTVGVLGRFNLGSSVRHALRLVAEFRWLGEGYRPGYFDTFYEVDKVLMMGTGGVAAGSGRTPLTKLEATVGPGRAKESRAGYYVEASYAIPEALGLSVALEGEGGTSAKNFIAHLEVPFLSWLQIFGTLYVRGFDDAGSMFAFDERSVAFAGLRLKPLPILFINARCYQTFQLDAFKGKDGPLGTLQYRNVFGVAADLGFGWEF